jgi:hypothetical protein
LRLFRLASNLSARVGQRRNNPTSTNSPHAAAPRL